VVCEASFVKGGEFKDMRCFNVLFVLERKMAMVAVMPNRKSVACAAILLAVALAPGTNSLLGM
jgi:hypothetical protein